MNSITNKRELTEAELNSLMEYLAQKKCLKSDYAYYISAMSRWNVVGCYPEDYLKDDVISEFRKVARSSYWKIGHFLTLKEFSISIGIVSDCNGSAL